MRPSVTGFALVRQLLALVVGGGLFILALVFSLVLFSALAFIGFGFLGYFWWKTRALRQAIREQAMAGPTADSATAGEVIEGEAVVVEESRSEVKQITQEVS